MNEKAKRYAIFAIGLFINSLGVSFITTADLGTSPISSIPYVLSLNAPLSLGQFTILFNLLIVLVQLPILKKQFQWEHWLQVPVTLLFGWFIDLTMVPLAAIAPQTYLWKLGFLLLGCLILGFGVYLEMAANVAMLPGESFVRAVSTTWHRDFGLTKIVFDVSMSLTAAGLSLILAHTLDGGGHPHRRPFGGAGGPNLPAGAAPPPASGRRPAGLTPFPILPHENRRDARASLLFFFYFPAPFNRAMARARAALER